MAVGIDQLLFLTGLWIFSTSHENVSLKFDIVSSMREQFVGSSFALADTNKKFHTRSYRPLKNQIFDF